jgi:DNA-binding NtrC family response regulator
MSWTASEAPTDTAEACREPAGEAAPEEVLVINRDPEMRLFVQKALYLGSISSTLVATESEAAACLRKSRYGVVVVAIESPESLETIVRLRTLHRRLQIAAVARAATPELVRDVLRAGASDFIFGTMDGKSIVPRLRAMIEAGRAAAGGHELPRPAGEPEPPAAPQRSEAASRIDIISIHPKMCRVLEIAGKIAATDSTVLIQGESGTGKELVARWVHERSRRASGPFVEINCGALPENLLESQLFGHEKGSFTGAVHRQLGLFEVADSGTIFLDEIGEMGLDMQVKLLRVLQSREFRRIGGSHVVKVDVRVIAATNRELKAEVEKGRFRTDLFYRLNVIALDLPPLRERREEIPHLVEAFCARFAAERGLPRKTFAPAGIEALQKLRWDGNVRELENAVERLILLARGDVVEVGDIEEHLEKTPDVALDCGFALTLTLDEVKRLHVGRVLAQNGGNKMKTARVLGVNVKTLYNLLRG